IRTVSLNVKSRISNVIKKFKFEDLESAVLPCFPELSWEQIKAKLVKNHESLTTPHALRIIEEEIAKKKLSESILKTRLATLEVIDVSRHYKRKVWYTYEFKSRNENRDNPETMSLEEIEDKIMQSFDVYQMEMEVQAIEHEDIVFLSIKDKPTKKKIKNILPTYFSLIMNENFFFCSKKLVMKNILMAVVEGMGYKNCKLVKLTGRDIPSLVQMLLTKKENGTVKAPLPFRPAAPVSTSLGLDFTQHKQREEYVDKCFGENPPTFEVLKVKSLDQKWIDEEAAEKLPDEVIFTGVEFRSQSIPNFLKNLVTQKVLTTPLPCYAANILQLGRNDFTVKENHS
ncbi:hypothetical protein TSAR_010430, partial [Trichomalopsis sarcophagae]